MKVDANRTFKHTKACIAVSGVNILNITIHAFVLLIYLKSIGKGKNTTKKLITMCKSEIFAEILNLVGKETEVSTELILSSSKVTEVVDARSIVVFFLTEYGLYPEQIAALLHKTSASIRYLISTFESRKNTNKMIAIYLQNIRKSLENEC